MAFRVRNKDWELLELENAIKEKPYDLVLLDFNMPVMDGLTATRKVREWEQNQDNGKTPIVALTAHALKEHEERSAAAGCDGHLSKPIKKKILIEAIVEYAKQ